MGNRQLQPQPQYDHSSRPPLLPIKHLPEVNDGSWRPHGDEVLVKLCDEEHPPKDWDISTPAPAHPGQRWYWLLLPVALGIILGIVIYAHMPIGTRETVADQAKDIMTALWALAIS